MNDRDLHDMYFKGRKSVEEKNAEVVADFEEDLSTLPFKWAEVGISPDAFVTCASCGGIFADAALEGDRICQCKGGE